MTNNIYDTANQLERELRQLPAYLKVKEALEEINQHPETKQLFEDFRQLSMEIYQETGDSDESKVELVQNLYGQVMGNESIKKLMENEQQLGLIMEDINSIIARPLQEIYQAPTK